MDIFATKGIEYLLVIGYLCLLIPFWWLVRRISPGAMVAARAAYAGIGRGWSWFEVPRSYHFHRGHTWAHPEGADLLKVGIDDFAQRLIGEPTAVHLPAIGDEIDQGETGWQLEVDGHAVDLLSPVKGQVVSVNEEVVRTPELICADPYGRGWLLTVRVREASTALKNLLPGRLAREWAEEARAGVVRAMGSDLGPVLQDGGVPVSGFARQLDGEHWPEIAAELLLTAPRTPPSAKGADRVEA